MGKTYKEIDGALSAFIAQQRMFFVSTAPLASDGHVNVSPKGLDSFRVLAPTRVAYVDYTGSGIETVAHVRENGRLTIMFCAFDGNPRILRLYGRGRVVEPSDAEFEQLMRHFEPLMSVRSILVLDVKRIADSCGFSVPLYDFKAERDQLTRWASKKDGDALAKYQREKNAESLDGLPGLRTIGGLAEPAGKAGV